MKFKTQGFVSLIGELNELWYVLKEYKHAYFNLYLVLFLNSLLHPYPFFFRKNMLKELAEISRGGESGGFQWSDEGKMNLSTKGIKMSRPYLGTGPKIPWPSPG